MKCVLLLLMLGYSSLLTAQPRDTTSKSLGVFINCQFCFTDYLRTEITWVNFVQDQFVADVNLLVATITTGSGGTEWKLIVSGMKELNGMTDTVKFTTSAINTESESRELLAAKVKLVLVRYALSAGMDSTLMVSSLDEKDIDDIGIGSNPETDPFNAWVFVLNGNANIDGQKIFQAGYFNANVDASQVKEDFKLRLYFSGAYSEQRFKFNEQEYSFVLRSQYTSAFYVRSLNDHWSAGVFASTTISDFSNYDLNQDISAAVEYDLFPYHEAQTRFATLSYNIGATYFDFTDTTIYNKTSITVPTHSLNLRTSFTQTWGTLSGGINSSVFLNDWSKYRYGGWTNFDVRIFKGFSVNAYLSFNVVRDQVNIRKAGASEDEILLQQQELETNYNFYSYMGVSYRFGSIYNNVVNPRFGF